ncbi:hypothetical protein ABLO26_02320 [Neobacillus sp. 179-J 1A1 HS]|uniref:hypothetical protein n=1 Tax=Neobacillus driksii TaxID=3035913 RepID=UPI0035BBC830
MDCILISKNTNFILEKIGFDSVFDTVADGTEIKNSNPDPEVFLLDNTDIQVWSK